MAKAADIFALDLGLRRSSTEPYIRSGLLTRFFSSQRANFSARRDVSIITFDIFDTLLHRRLRAPVDLFELVRLKAFESTHALYAHDILDNYFFFRIRAERESRERRVKEHGGEGEVTLAEIYAEFQNITYCTDALRGYLMAAELALEEAHLFASPEGLKRYFAARRSGAKVALISDMYLPSDWIATRLSKAGFAGVYELPIYVSGEHRASKHTGALYDLVADDLRLKDRANWLHIGDNRYSDVEKAEEKGLKASHADWSKVVNCFEPVHGFNDSHAIRSLIAFLDTPQAGQFIPKDPFEKLGYTIWGPMLLGFTFWLFKECRRQNKDHVLFIARDGWLPQQLFEGLKKKAGLAHVTTEYFYMSRKTAYMTGLRDWDTHFNWHITSGKSPKSLERCLGNIGISACDYSAQAVHHGVPDVGSGIGLNERHKIKNTIDTLYSKILEVNRDNREIFRDYFAAVLDKNRQVAIVDIGWGGNIQRNLISSIDDLSARSRIVGLYLGTLGFSKTNAERGCKFHGWVCDGGTPHSWEELFSNGGVELMEFVLTANHGSTLALRHDDQGKVVPVLEAAHAEEEDYRSKAMRAQVGVRRFVDDYKYLLDYFDPESLSSPAWAMAFERLVRNPTKEEAELLGDLTHSEAPGSTRDRLPLAQRLPWKHRIHKGRVKRARNASFWKAGFDRLNS